MSRIVNALTPHVTIYTLTYNEGGWVVIATSHTETTLDLLGSFYNPVESRRTYKSWWIYKFLLSPTDLEEFINHVGTKSFYIPSSTLEEYLSYRIPY